MANRKSRLDATLDSAVQCSLDKMGQTCGRCGEQWTDGMLHYCPDSTLRAFNGKPPGSQFRKGPAT